MRETSNVLLSAGSGHLRTKTRPNLGLWCHLATETYRDRPPLIEDMAPTVDELRNEIRLAVGRFERVESTAFTKETLAAICEAVDYDIDTDRLPGKAKMRAGILVSIGELDDDDPSAADRPFRKADLEAIAASLDAL